MFCFGTGKIRLLLLAHQVLQRYQRQRSLGSGNELHGGINDRFGIVRRWDRTFSNVLPREGAPQSWTVFLPLLAECFRISICAEAAMLMPHLNIRACPPARDSGQIMCR